MTPEEVTAQNNGLIIGAVMAGHFYAPKSWKYFDVAATKDALTGYVRGVYVRLDIRVAYPDALTADVAEGVSVLPDVRLVDTEVVENDTE